MPVRFLLFVIVEIHVVRQKGLCQSSIWVDESKMLVARCLDLVDESERLINEFSAFFWLTSSMGDADKQPVGPVCRPKTALAGTMAISSGRKHETGKCSQTRYDTCREF